MRAGAVVSGTIAAGHATLQLVNGTIGATGYSLAENGASVVFTARDDIRLFKVPVSGGAATVLSSLQGGAGTQLPGVSCNGSTSLVANDAVTLIGAPGACAVVNAGAKELYRGVTRHGGAAAGDNGRGGIIVLPQVSPVSGGVVVQIGGSVGHLQTIRAPSDANLHLLRALIP